jgi:hypothetical protein
MSDQVIRSSEEAAAEDNRDLDAHLVDVVGAALGLDSAGEAIVTETPLAAWATEVIAEAAEDLRVRVDESRELVTTSPAEALEATLARHAKQKARIKLLAEAYCCPAGRCMTARYGFPCHAIAIYFDRARAGALAIDRAESVGDDSNRRTAQ